MLSTSLLPQQHGSFLVKVLSGDMLDIPCSSNAFLGRQPGACRRASGAPRLPGSRQVGGAGCEDGAATSASPPLPGQRAFRTASRSWPVSSTALTCRNAKLWRPPASAAAAAAAFACSCVR